MSIERVDLLPPVVEGLVYGILDEELHALTGHVPVGVHNPDFVDGDEVFFFWQGVTVDHQPDDFEYSVTVGQGHPDYDAATRTVRIKVPVAHVKATGRGGRVVCGWTMQRAGLLVDAQRQAFTVGLPLPTLQVFYSSDLQIGMGEFTGDLPVWAWPWPAMRIGDRATLTVLPEDGSAGLSLVQSISDPAHLGHPLQWKVQRSRLSIWQSQRKAILMQLKVLTADGKRFAYARQRFTLAAAAGPREEPARLPPGAGGSLDPDAYPDGLQVLLPEGLPVNAGDLLSLTWTAAGEEPSVFQQIADWSTLHTGYARFTVPYSTLLAHNHRDVVIDWQLDSIASNLAGRPLSLAVRSKWVLKAPTVVGMASETPGDQPGDVRGWIGAENVRFQGLRVRVPSDFDIGIDDVIEVHLEGDSAGGRYSTSIPASGTRDFIIPPAYVAPNMGGEGKRAPIYYTITSPGAGSVESPKLHLRVAALAQTAMPMPQCPQAQGGITLSLSELNSLYGGKADILVSPWPFYQHGQRLKVLAKGVRGGQTGEQVLYDGSVSDSMLTQSLPVSFLETLTLSAGVDVSASVAFDTRNFMLARTAHLNLKA